MAGAARPLERAILEQTTYLANADGTVTPDEQKAIDEAQTLVGAVAALTPGDAAERDGRKATHERARVVLARPEGVRSAGGREGRDSPDARAPGRARLPGD